MDYVYIDPRTGALAALITGQTAIHYMVLHCILLGILLYNTTMHLTIHFMVLCVTIIYTAMCCTVYETSKI